MATKKTEEVKTEVKTAETATEAKKPAKSASKKTPAKKPAAKAEQKKVVTKIQFGGKELDTDDIVAACKADYKAKTNGHVRTINVYVKPEESVAYYVVNDKVSDKIEL